MPFTTLESTLALRTPEHLFLTNLKKNAFDDSAFFARLKEIYNESLIDFIIKIANANCTFALLCKKEEYNQLWGLYYSCMGGILTLDYEQPALLIPHGSDNFDLLRGAYFFYKSQVVRNELGRDFFHEELLFLKKGIEYNSIHAIQRYIVD